MSFDWLSMPVNHDCTRLTCIYLGVTVCLMSSCTAICWITFSQRHCLSSSHCQSLGGHWHQKASLQSVEIGLLHCLLQAGWYQKAPLQSFQVGLLQCLLQASHWHQHLGSLQPAEIALPPWACETWGGSDTVFLGSTASTSMSLLGEVGCSFSFSFSVGVSGGVCSCARAAESWLCKPVICCCTCQIADRPVPSAGKPLAPPLPVFW